MRFEIMEQRLNSVLERDKCGSPEFVCEVLKGELSPLIQNYIELNSDLVVRYKKVGDRLTFNVEIDAIRVRAFGYLPR